MITDHVWSKLRLHVHGTNEKTNQTCAKWMWCTSRPFTFYTFTKHTPPLLFHLHLPASPNAHMHTHTHALPWWVILYQASFPLWAAYSVGTREWMNDLEISLFRMVGFRKQSCKPGPLGFPGFIHNKKRETEPHGEREDRGMVAPSPPILPPPHQGLN